MQVIDNLIDERRVSFIPNLLSVVLGVAGTPAGITLRGRISPDHVWLRVLLRPFRPGGRAEELPNERAQHANLSGRCSRPMHWLFMGDGAVGPKLLSAGMKRGEKNVEVRFTHYSKQLYLR